MSSKLRVTLRKSMVGIPPDQVGTVRALGLRRIGQTVEKEDRPEIRGMLFKVKHLIQVEEADQKQRKQAKGKGK